MLRRGLRRRFRRGEAGRREVHDLFDETDAQLARDPVALDATTPRRGLDVLPVSPRGGHVERVRGVGRRERRAFRAAVVDPFMGFRYGNRRERRRRRRRWRGRRRRCFFNHLGRRGLDGLGAPLAESSGAEEPELELFRRHLVPPHHKLLDAFLRFVGLGPGREDK